jgi:hypothetical protein
MIGIHPSSRKDSGGRDESADEHERSDGESHPADRAPEHTRAQDDHRCGGYQDRAGDQRVEVEEGACDLERPDELGIERSGSERP